MPRNRFSTRRGRPRTPRITQDTGTPELRQKHAAGATSETIDLCLRHHLITEAQHRAALHFRWLYTLRFGAPSVQALDLTSPRERAAPQEDTAWLQARQQEYRHAAQALESRHLLVAVFDDPTPLRSGSHTAADCLHRLREGLGLLMRLWNPPRI